MRALRPIPGSVAVVLTALALLTLLGPAPARAEPARGDTVTVRGQVVDYAGRPVSGVEVLLEVSRTRFSLRKFDQVEGEALRLPANTDTDGRFRFDWRWDPHYNTFAVSVGMAVQRGGKPDFEIVQRIDITESVASGAADVRVEVGSAGYLRWLKSYMAGTASADEIKIYREKGRPDRVETSEHFDGETTWWYFAEGRSYRFVGGTFERVVHFDPIPDPAPLVD